MAVYDRNVNIPDADLLPKQDNANIHFSDGGFYPYLKYLINQSTKVPNTHIYIRDYGENNPFLEQSKDPKIYCELFEFDSPCISGNFNARGDMSLYASVKYRVYFVNDNKRSPFLFEAMLKGNVDVLEKVTRDFIELYKTSRIAVPTPSTITMPSRKVHKGFSVYPIIIYDVVMSGYITQNIKELENVPFNEIDMAVILQ